ncbi:MAG: SAM-dependent methyltransferase [bacterium]|nr:SAM-dependent methyltransferase [bacterium]
MPSKKISSSFRDPSGFLFTSNGQLYRQINTQYKENYEFLARSGLLKKLQEENLLINHKEAGSKLAQTSDAYKVIKPEKIPFISYPYEWCFSMLKDAALLTLEIQKTALGHGLSLRDASAYNIQFLRGKPIHIDTLSFEKFQEKPWVAYKQFCQHFLAPLALMTYTDVSLNKLSQLFIDGIPLDLASKLLPTRTRFKPSLLIHIHLHAASQRKYADRGLAKQPVAKKFNKRSFLGLIDSLEGAIKGLKWEPKGTQWSGYYEGNLNYLPASLRHKANLVEEFLESTKPRTVWDLGANTGLFSRIAADKGIFTVSSDIDPAAVEINYKTTVEKNEKNILPILIDLTNPSPAIGWENKERDSFLSRGPVDTALALALVHHLAISNNLPLAYLAEFFSLICKSLIIEFIPKEDSQVQKLLASREDIFPNYSQNAFEKEFSALFSIKRSEKVKGSKRTLYLMSKKANP